MSDNQQSEIEWKALSNGIVLENTFKYLNARELNSCSRVCSLWRDEANKSKQNRKQMCWQAFRFEDATIGQDVWWNTINSYLVECTIEPRSVIMFCSETMWSCVVQPGVQSSRRRRKSCDITELYPFSLPTNCSVHITVTDGVVATYEDNKIQEYDEHDMVVTMMIFGAWPGLELVHFSCDHSESQMLARHWAGKGKELPLALMRLRKKEVKMINLFSPMSGIDPGIGYCLYKIFDWPLIGGGYVNEKYVKASDGSFNRFASDILMSGVAICGAGVKVASVLIKDEVETEVEVDRLIKELAEHKFPLEHSFGLMYACVGRGIHIYEGLHNVESKAFRKHFPNTPLFGFFGNGEIGWNFPPVDPLHMPSKRKRSSESPDSSSEGSGAMSDAQFKRQFNERRRKDNEYLMKHPPKLLHAYTTVMCLVSLPNPTRR